MSLLRFMTSDQIDDLPDEPLAAFLSLASICEAEMDELVADVDSDINSTWHHSAFLRHDFMNVIIAAAKKYNIGEISNISVPSVDDFNDGSFLYFKKELDHYLTQLILSQSRENKRTSVALSAPARSKIETYVAHLREQVEKSDMEAWRKAGLFKILDDFSQALSKKRFPLVKLGVLATTIFGLSADSFQNFDGVTHLLRGIEKIVGQEKALEPPDKQLIPPEMQNQITSRKSSIDDGDIPF